MNDATSMNTAVDERLSDGSRRITETTSCDQVCGERLFAKEGRSSGVLDKVLALAFCMLFLFLAVAGSLWIVEDSSATLMPVHHVH